MYMEHKLSVTPKDFFLWVAATVALYVSTISLLALWFEFIDRMWAQSDPYGYVDPYSAGIRIAVASLIVIFPLYVYFMRLLHTDIRLHREKRELWVRKWVLGATLFIAGLTMVVELIVLINAFLGGEELTTAFLLKVLSVFVVVGGAFMYYLYEARGTWERKERESKGIALGVALVVLASIIGAFFFMGSPSEQRARRYDAQRISDLQSIQWSITDYWQRKEALPATLDEMKDPLSGTLIPTDPEEDMGYVYEYIPTGVTPSGVAVFELCATFARADLEDSQGVSKPRGDMYYMDVSSEYWQHDAGRVCFKREIDPEKYPPYEKVR